MNSEYIIFMAIPIIVVSSIERTMPYRIRRLLLFRSITETLLFQEKKIVAGVIVSTKLYAGRETRNGTTCSYTILILFRENSNSGPAGTPSAFFSKNPPYFQYENGDFEKCGDPLAGKEGWQQNIAIIRRLESAVRGVCHRPINSLLVSCLEVQPWPNHTHLLSL